MRVLNFLRLIDESGLLSITNIIVWIVAFKLAMCNDINFGDTAALFTAVAAYQFKSWNVRKKKVEKTPTDKMSELESKIDNLSLAIGLRKL